MKSKISFLLLAVLLTSLWGCGGSQVETKEEAAAVSEAAGNAENAENVADESGNIGTASENSVDVFSLSKEELQEFIVGDWVKPGLQNSTDDPVYGNTLSLYGDMSYEYGYNPETDSRQKGTWEIESGSNPRLYLWEEQMMFTYEFQLLTEDGLIILQGDNSSYIRQEDSDLYTENHSQNSIELKSLLLGDWILELNPDGRDSAVFGKKLTLYEDMTYEYGYDTRKKGRRRGSWQINENEAPMISMMDDELLYSYGFNLLEEDGLQKLINEDSGDIYIRPEDKDAVYETKYMSVLITDKNRDQYIGEFRYVGPSIKEIESKGIVDFYFTENLIYKDGWIYVGASDNFSVMYDEEHEARSNPYGLTWAERGNSDPENNVPYEIWGIMGRIFYIREEYVDHVYIDESGYRVVVLKSGSEIYGGYYWDYLPEGTYEKYPY